LGWEEPVRAGGFEGLKRVGLGLGIGYAVIVEVLL